METDNNAEIDVVLDVNTAEPADAEDEAENKPEETKVFSIVVPIDDEPTIVETVGDKVEVFDDLEISP